MVDISVGEAVFAEERKEGGEEEVEGAEGAAGGFGGVEPAGVVREESAGEVAAFLQREERVEMAGEGVAVEAVEGDPGAAVGGGGEVVVAGGLGVDPDEGGGRDAVLTEDVELGEGGAAAGVNCDGQAGSRVGECGGGDEFAVGFGEGGLGVDPAFDEAGTDVRIGDPITRFGDPAAGELLGGFGVCVGREEFVLTGAVETGVGDEVKVGGCAEAGEQARVAAEEVRRALEERTGAEIAGLAEVRERGGEDGIGVVAGGRDLVGADEIDEDVLVRKRAAEGAREDGAADGLDLGCG